MIKGGLFHSDGQPFDGERFKRELQEGVMNMATSRVERALGGIVCPVHHKRATVTRTVSGWKIAGCCEQLKEGVRKALGEKLRRA
jgi:hypothetical protein